MTMLLSFSNKLGALGITASAAFGVTSSPAFALLCGGVPPAVFVEHQEEHDPATIEWRIVLGGFLGGTSDLNSWETIGVRQRTTNDNAAIMIARVIRHDLHFEGIVIDGGSLTQEFSEPVAIEVIYYFDHGASNAQEDLSLDYGRVPWLAEESLLFLHRHVDQDQWQLRGQVSGCSGQHIPSPRLELLEEVSACMAIPGPDCWIDWIHGEREFVWR